MKRIFTLLFFVIIATAASAQTAASAPTQVEILQLKEAKYDFGKIQQNRPVTHSFEIVNKGKEPFKLDNVQASCGCTTPEWSRDPIAPGGTAVIKVGYNAATEGPFSKNITIQYNGTQTATILISGTVFKAPETSAPANPSISLLKQTNQ
jgi:hypothetical protein